MEIGELRRFTIRLATRGRVDCLWCHEWRPYFSLLSDKDRHAPGCPVAELESEAESKTADPMAGWPEWKKRAAADMFEGAEKGGWIADGPLAKLAAAELEAKKKAAGEFG